MSVAPRLMDATNNRLRRKPDCRVPFPPMASSGEQPELAVAGDPFDLAVGEAGDVDLATAHVRGAADDLAVALAERQREPAAEDLLGTDRQQLAGEAVQAQGPAGDRVRAGTLQADRERREPRRFESDAVAR